MKKKIYLTIDDGPSPYTREKMDLLLEKKIPAVWYLRGEFIEKHIDHVVYGIEQGFVMGNHSYSHPYFSEICFEQAKQEILQTEALIEKAFALAGKKRGDKIFRFPFLDKGSPNNKTKLQAFLKEQGFVRVNFEGVTYQYYNSEKWGEDLDAPWTFDAREYALFEERLKDKYKLYQTKDFLSRMEKFLPEKGLGLVSNKSNDIVLLHDFHQTPQLFQPMIEKLLSFDADFSLPTIETV